MTSTIQGHVPLPVDLQWVRGDTPEFSFLFKGVNWVETDPSITDEPTWVGNTWQAQVRNPYWYAVTQPYTWVPVYGYQFGWWQERSGVATFAMAADLTSEAGGPVADTTFVVDTSLRTVTTLNVGDTLTAGFYTRVRLQLPSDMSAVINPGAWYRWDLQTSSTADTPPIRKTHLRGRVRIFQEWTLL